MPVVSAWSKNYQTTVPGVRQLQARKITRRYKKKRIRFATSKRQASVKESNDSLLMCCMKGEKEKERCDKGKKEEREDEQRGQIYFALTKLAIEPLRGRHPTFFQE